MEEAPSAEIIPPPPDQIKKLQEAAKMGSVTDLKEGILKLRKTGLLYQPFTDKIDSLARTYQFDEIIEFLQQHMEN